MSYVLDTHAWLWLAAGDARAKKINRLRHDADLSLSVVSIWEATLLHTKGRIVLRPEPREFFDKFTDAIGIRCVPLSRIAAAEAGLLPGNFHGDPADRFIVATCLLQNSTLVTADRRILRYKHASFQRFAL